MSFRPNFLCGEAPESNTLAHLVLDFLRDPVYEDR